MDEREAFAREADAFLERDEPVAQDVQTAAEPDEPAEEAQEEQEASELRELVQEMEQAKEDEDINSAQPAEDAPKTAKGPGGFAWLAAILMMLFGLVMFIPFLCNTLLGLFALDGLLKEATGQYRSAYDAYGILAEVEPSIAQLGESIFAPGSGAVPAYTTGSFVQERMLLYYMRLYGPMHSYTQQYFGMWFPEGAKVPRSLRVLSDITQVITNVNAELNQEDEADVMYRNAIAAAREKDTVKSHDLIYDVLEMYEYADQSIVSEEMGERLEALQKAKGSQPWMYEDLAFSRAVLMGDYAVAAKLCGERLRRNGESIDMMGFQVKATYLSGDKEKAYALADTYSGKPGAYNWILLVKAELKYRDGDYDEAVALAGEVAAAAEADPAYAEYLPEATAIQAVALLLADKAEEALDLLRPFVEANAQVSGNFLSTLLAAAIAAGDETYYDAVMESQTMMMAQYVSGYAVPPALEELKAGQTTLETIFTEGWGGFIV